MVARRSARQDRFKDKVRAAAERHQHNMIRRAVQRDRDVPLHYFDYSYWWMRRCGFCGPEYAHRFNEIWRWWKTLDLMAQYALMRFNRQFGTKD